MTTAALKKKIKALVDKETSEKKLAKVHDTLTKETKADAVRREMREVADASELAIKEGRTHSKEAFGERSEAFVAGLFKSKGRRTAASRKPVARKVGH